MEISKERQEYLLKKWACMLNYEDTSLSGKSAKCMVLEPQERWITPQSHTLSSIDGVLFLKPNVDQSIKP